MSVQRNLPGQPQQFNTVLTRVGSHTTQVPLIKESCLVVQGGNRCHVDTRQGQRSSPIQGGKGTGDQFTCWREDNSGLQFFWREVCCIPNPDRSHTTSEGLVFGSSGSDIDLTPPIACNLNDDMGRGAKAIEAESFPATHPTAPERPVADDPRTQQRRHFDR